MNPYSSIVSPSSPTSTTQGLQQHKPVVATAGGGEQQQHHPRRRQQRLHLSCSECRRRKIRCDRAKPCYPCVKADRGGRCQYDTPPATPGKTVPGQLVFAARPARDHHHHHHHHHQVLQHSPSAASATPPPQQQQQQQRGGNAGVQQQPTTPSADSQLHPQQQRPQHPRPPPPPPPGRFSPAEVRASGGATAGYETNAQAADAIPLLRQFWHGSKAGDQYVSPFDRRTITVPKEVVFGDDDATVFWGRSHEANFVPRVSCIMHGIGYLARPGPLTRLTHPLTPNVAYAYP